ncbi:MAG TPA: HWE histidine kinase domain-containing protein [Pseudorhizobium sp.]|jgi:two-component sensor histidine kinase|nr:HWE histidine kinase domain-containing protein [Pseudorhizobium sp.]
MKLKLVAVAIAALAPVVTMLAFNEVATRYQRNEEVRAGAVQAAIQASSELQRIVEGTHSLLIAATAMPSVQALDQLGCSKALRSVASRVQNIGTIFVLDPQGKMVCGSADAPVTDFADRDYFKSAIETMEFVVGTHTNSRIADVRVLPVALPILESGSVKAVVVTGIRLDWLQSRLAARGVLEGNAVTVADGNGTILARIPYPERFVGTVIPETYQSLVHSHVPGVVEVRSQDGTERILAYRPISLPTNPLYVSAGFSRDEAFAPINRATIINSLAIVGGALFSFLAAILIGNRFFLTPIKRISGTMERWRRGDSASRTGMSGGDEIEAVGATLDGLFDELDSRRRREQLDAEERDLLSRELAHRVKNGFALVQAIARQTFHRTDPERYQSFSERLAGLAQTYDLLLARNSGASSIGEVVTNALRAHVGNGSGRVHMEGHDITLPAAVGLSLSLVIHELATNATKYGSLGSDDGTISIIWTPVGDKIHMIWRESGGPPVEPPLKNGFGSLLIQRAFPAIARAHCTFDYRQAGLVFQLEFEVADPEARGS